MFAGHFGLAAAVKSKSPELPLWTLIVATQLLDVLFVPLYVSGIETLEIVDQGGYGHAIIHADYTHSLLVALVLSLVAGWYALKKWNKRNGIVIGAMVFSHWILDLLVHRVDLPILPGNLGDLPLLGFSLWKYPAISIMLEVLLIALGIVLYFRSVIARARMNTSSNHKNSLNKAYTAGIVFGGLLILSLITDILGLG
ncbi:permease [Paenibacillus albiflavus]|uniref:Permease n=1 Tax=Paenibacillus albiflavus TaxID=2545760 RepID=A0A4V2WNS6_9BACL|nr:permease [Paenibacillus albiflavus]TCZ76612.1 permease [Paenibacillus albiflavus]